MIPELGLGRAQETMLIIEDAINSGKMKKIDLRKLTILDEQKGVKVISIIEWINHAYGEDYWDGVEGRPDYEQVTQDLMAWCADNDSAYWAAPREDFFIHTAVDYAKARGHKRVVVEDLS